MYLMLNAQRTAFGKDWKCKRVSVLIILSH